MVGDPVNVLFICTGNSCRSVMAECLLRRLGHGRFACFSAGSRPTGNIHPRAISLLRREGHDVGGLRSKSWDEFAGNGAPELDMVITVCDSAAGETCPVWFGAPVTGHWGFPDPPAFTGDDEQVELGFAEVYDRIAARVERFVGLIGDGRDTASLGRVLRRMEEERDE